MSFVSIEFLFFYPIVTLLYFLIPRRSRWMLVLPASMFFFLYANPKHGVVFGFIIVLSYFLGLVAYQDPERARLGPIRSRLTKPIVVSGLIGLLIPLAFFKYGHFITSQSANILSYIGFNGTRVFAERSLPLGISFFTLQGVGYVFDVWRKETEPQRNFFKFTLFKTFYPQLVAGPIERYHHIFKQLVEPRQPTFDQFTEGLKIFAWGVFKKVVVADNLGKIVDPIFNSPGEHSPEVLLIAALAFTFQIYGDFSGYSDMAIGIGKTMGIDLMKNFSMPYFSRSIPEFWQRWHISLSTWFRDYLYIPLGGNRKGYSRWLVNVFAVFMVSGLWHGANFTFVIWGLIHAIGYFTAVYFNRFIRKIGLKTPQSGFGGVSLGMLYGILTFSWVSIGWIFFRANSVQEAFHISGSILLSAFTLDMHFTTKIFEFLGYRDLYIGAGAIACLLAVESLILAKFDLDWLRRRPSVVRWSAYYALVTIILVLGNFGRSKFIYFQF